ncbi:hypothetical protein RFI_02679 [Reticulomyxa filosa]|uniref:J domain-containing protein n=1 Tax=Reticulomyxa filosa TaxID=46433 RepID=X6P8B6_RETFI|nr:hypothetical protein RFI_02679 [Reticulomyxa filosa]|eukprot:ETO34416.1 hypothetical protein RFI_02679 [Reticulomyxa filosa]
MGGHIYNAAASGVEIVGETIKVGGCSAAAVSGCQCVADTARWCRGKISSQELGRRTLKNATVNGTAVVGGAGGSTVGATIGTGHFTLLSVQTWFIFFFLLAILPGTGTVVGSIVGGVCGSIGVGKLVNDKFDDWWGPRGSDDPTQSQDTTTTTTTTTTATTTTTTAGNKALPMSTSTTNGYVCDDALCSSLQFFGFLPKDFGRTEVVNMDILVERYREYSRVYHPQKGGTKEEWLCLINHFAVAANAIRDRDGAGV